MSSKEDTKNTKLRTYRMPNDIIENLDELRTMPASVSHVNVIVNALRKVHKWKKPKL